MADATSSTERRQNVFAELTRVSPSSTTLEKGPFDVFINHRGSDVKRTLASNIYHFLDRLRVKVFLDREELELGDFFPKEIEDVMRSARIHIAIFSKDYATSPYCLEELSLMLEIGAIIIPVFYYVEPTDLRWEVTRGLYAAAFSKYETDCRYESETLKKWKRALHKVSFHTGYEFNSNSDEGDLLDRIVDRVQQEIKNAKVPLDVATYPVGLDDAVRDFENIIRSARVHQSVQIVGVVGTGGLGKTTLALELYNRKFKAFDNCSFLSDVREAALSDLQKKLLEDLLYLRDIPFKDAIQGKSILAGRLRSTSPRVLIVLDDVDDVDQLNALLPEKGTSLGSGSLIIVTTRDSDVLAKWDISVYKMTTLVPRHAKELFCLHAFKGVSPPDAFEDLVNKFVEACNGLPLSLKVIAEMLYKKPEDVWKSELMKISRLLPGEIKKRLRLSYDALDEEQKNIFLDVACFFVGEKKKLAIAVWDAARWSGLETLESKCLVEVDKQNRIRMHNHLRDLGRELACECSPHRLWSSEQITKIMRYRQQRMLIRGIMAATTQFVACSTHDEFPKCRDPYQPPSEECMDLRCLELLVVTGKYFTSSDFAGLLRDLVWLRLFDFHDTDLPSWLSVTNLRVLELYGASGLQLWENNAHPPKELREMIITATEGNIFHRFPSKISGLEHLKKIALISDHGKEFCFATLPDEFCYLQSLEHLELRYCKFLSSLPNCFGKLKKLHHLDLCSCEKLRKLPESFMQLASLEYLDLSGCRLPEILDPMPEILKNIRNLKNLYFSGCRLQKLPEHTTDQQSLRELHLEDTMLRNVPSNISQLSKLETLKIGSPYLRNLPTSLGDLPSLTNLKIKGCDKLKYLPPSVERLKLLESLYLEDSEVESLPEGFRQLTNLQTLQIFDCPIAELDFSSASSSSLGKLKVIHLKGTNVTRVLISQDCCPSLETLQLELNRHLMEIDILSTSVKMVKVFKCPKLHNIKGIRNLVNLKTLEIKGCQKLDEDTVAAVGTWECFNSVQSHTDVQFFLNPVEGHNASVSFEGGYETEQEVNLEVCLG